MAKKAKKATKSGRGTNAASPTADVAKQHPFELPIVSSSQKKRAVRLLQMLRKHYPDAHCELNYTKPHELLIATILSAQSTDVGVNKATPALFKRFPTPGDYAASTPEEIEPYVRTTGFFRNKARAVHESMEAVVERFGGEVPRTMDELLSLRGVARKTANVVLGNAFGINVGFVVDTHVERLSNRLALVPEGSTVAMIERHLMALFPQDSWCEMSHMLIWHGRRACSARRPGGKCCREHPVCDGFGIRCELER
jgi:endonuclease-3